MHNWRQVIGQGQGQYTVDLTSIEASLFSSLTEDRLQPAGVRQVQLWWNWWGGRRTGLRNLEKGWLQKCWVTKLGNCYVLRHSSENWGDVYWSEIRMAAR